MFFFSVEIKHAWNSHKHSINRQDIAVVQFNEAFKKNGWGNLKEAFLSLKARYQVAVNFRVAM
jgi:hypothetical protein